MSAGEKAGAARARVRKCALVATACAMGVGLIPKISAAQDTFGTNEGMAHTGRSWGSAGPEGHRLNIASYGDYIVRVRACADGPFCPDSHYDMVDWHTINSLEASFKKPGTSDLLSPKAKDGLRVELPLKSSRLLYFVGDQKSAILSQSLQKITFEDNKVSVRFDMAPDEHFAGLGHGAYARVPHIDLRGSTISRNREHQSSMVVPFYWSSRGYGIFVNSTWPNTFSFQPDNYGFELRGTTELDYFVILGPNPEQILDRYTQLTGRPRMPPMAAFGLGVSDKRIADAKDLPSNEQWWKDTIGRMRAEKYPVSLIIHDNSWRNGKTAAWQWSPLQYPDPKEFAQWSRENGLANMLDFNREDDTLSEGWQSSFAIPGVPTFPDFTSKTTRDWFWNLFWTKSFDPKLGYPGDALWLDEFDENIKPAAALADGTTWTEAANYYAFLMAKAVGEGWDKNFAGSKRLLLMCRGMTAGAQRWATLWSGDINNTYDEMKYQIRGMQAAGMSGFPFWTHDAGGFHKKPSDAMYRQWSYAMGIFTPIWRPHGPGMRYPWMFSAEAQADAHLYDDLRMRMLPYTYSIAHQAAATGMPMVRAMCLMWPQSQEAWARDQQYMWGPDFLVAPDTSDGGGKVEVWFPAGKWYSFWDDKVVDGAGKETAAEWPSPTGQIPLFVRAGAVVPMAPVAQSALWLDRTQLDVHIWTGFNGETELIADDGATENYKKGEVVRRAIKYNDARSSVEIGVANGTYKDAPTTCAVRVFYHGQDAAIPLTFNGKEIAAGNLDASPAQSTAPTGPVASWDEKQKLLVVALPVQKVDQQIVIARKSAK